MTPSADRLASRRQMLLAGSVGAAATAFLAACGTKTPDTAGQSGLDPTTTLVTPTVPELEPSEVELATEQQDLRTAASLELVVAGAYLTYGKKLSDPELVAQTARIADDHTTLAAAFNAAVDAGNEVTDPNEWVQTHVIDPVDDQMTSDGPILTLMGKLESMLAASYTQVVNDATTTEWRARWASIAGGAARRAALLGNNGNGVAPTTALYPSTDAVSNQARLVTEAEGEG